MTETICYTLIVGNRTQDNAQLKSTKILVLFSFVQKKKKKRVNSKSGEKLFGDYALERVISLGRPTFQKSSFKLLLIYV